MVVYLNLLVCTVLSILLITFKVLDMKKYNGKYRDRATLILKISSILMIVQYGCEVITGTFVTNVLSFSILLSCIKALKKRKNKKQ